MKKVLILLLLGLVIACSSDQIVIQEPECPDEYAYEFNIKEIVDLSCATPGCHVQGGDGPGIYTTYEQLITFLEDGSFEQTIRDGSMPPQGSPQVSDEDMSRLLCWLQEGYPKNR